MVAEEQEALALLIAETQKQKELMQLYHDMVLEDLNGGPPPLKMVVGGNPVGGE